MVLELELRVWSGTWTWACQLTKLICDKVADLTHLVKLKILTTTLSQRLEHFKDW